MSLPEARLDQHSVDTSKGLLQALEQRYEEPLQPGGDIQCAPLARFQDAVIASAVIENARGHGVKADGLLFALSQCQVGDGARKAAVAVIKGVQGNEPEVRNAGTQKRVEAGIATAALEPGEEVFQLRFQSSAGWGLEMHGRVVEATRNYLHGLFAAQHADA